MSKMKNIKITTEIIKTLNPCNDRFDIWIEHYNDFNGTILEFLDLENITHSDKLWVALRLLPRHTVEVFAIDCAFSAAAASYAASYANYASYVTNHAADDAVAAHHGAYAAHHAAASYAAAYAAYADDAVAAHHGAYAAYAASYADDASYAADTERNRQIEALKYLIESEE